MRRSASSCSVCLGWTCAGCLDDVAAQGEGPLRGLPVLGGRDALAGLRERGVDGVVLAFGLGAGRRALIEPVRGAGLALPALVHPGAHVSPSARVADGAQVMASAVVGGDCSVGEAVLVNAGAVLEHDVLVEAGASIGPGAVLAGRAIVRAEAEVGAHATVLPDGVVAAGAKVAAGAVVSWTRAAGRGSRTTGSFARLDAGLLEARRTVAVLLRTLTLGAARVDDPDQRDHAAEDHEAAADAEPDAVGRARTPPRPRLSSSGCAGRRPPAAPRP